MNAKNWVIVGICAVVVLININYLANRGEADKTSGSCLVPRMDDGSKVCIEYAAHEQTGEFKQVCQPVMRGKWSDGPCETQGSLGGCQTGDNKMWFFPAGKYSSSSDVRSFCALEGFSYLAP